jgi:hypothetical protein
MLSHPGQILAAFDWTPIGLLATFIASMSATGVVYFKGRADNKRAREDRDLEQFNVREAQKVIQSNEMATIAFQTLERQNQNCEKRCDKLEADNIALRRTVAQQADKLDEQAEHMASQDQQIATLRRLVEGTS